MSCQILEIIAARNLDPQQVITYDLRKSPVRMIYLNPATYLFFRSRSDELSFATHIRFDGLYISKMMRMAGVHSWPRCSFDFSSLAGKFLQVASDLGYKSYLLGGSQAANEHFSKLVTERYSGIQLCGQSNGYFPCEDTIVSEITYLNPDIVIVGLGGRKQETFSHKLYSAGYVGSIITCGAFLEQTSMKTSYYPPLFVKLDIRWLYRLFKEKGIARRILVEYTRFLAVFLIDLKLFKKGLKRSESQNSF